MRKRNTLRILDGFEKKDCAVDQTKDTFEKIQLVLQLLLTNILIYVLRKLSEYDRI